MNKQRKQTNNLLHFMHFPMWCERWGYEKANRWPMENSHAFPYLMWKLMIWKGPYDGQWEVPMQNVQLHVSMFIKMFKGLCYFVNHLCNVMSQSKIGKVLSLKAWESTTFVNNCLCYHIVPTCLIHMIFTTFVIINGTMDFLTFKFDDFN